MEIQAAPKRNKKNRYDKCSYVTAVVNKLFSDESQDFRDKLIDMHCTMQPRDTPPGLSAGRPQHSQDDDPEVYSALAALDDTDRQHLDGLWQKASEAEFARRVQERSDKQTADAKVKGKGANGDAGNDNGNDDGKADKADAACDEGNPDAATDDTAPQPRARTYFKTPSTLRVLLPGQGCIVGLGLSCYQAHLVFIVSASVCE